MYILAWRRFLHLGCTAASPRGPNAAEHPTRMVWVTITATCAVTGHVYWMGKEQYVCYNAVVLKRSKTIDISNHADKYIVTFKYPCYVYIYILYVHIYIVKQKNLTFGGKDSSGMMSNLSRECDQDATRYSNFWLRTNLSQGLKAEEWSFPNKWMMFPDFPLFMGAFHAVCPTPRAYHPKQKRQQT